MEVLSSFGVQHYICIMLVLWDYARVQDCLQMCLNQFFSIPRRNGHQPVIYIDDTYLQGETVDACNQNVMAIFLM